MVAIHPDETERAREKRRRSSLLSGRVLAPVIIVSIVLWVAIVKLVMALFS